MKNIYLIISINIHENIKFLFFQLNNIKKYVKIKYIVILNSNEKMFNALKKYKIKLELLNCIVNHQFLNKKKFHGSITEGIYSNILLALNKYKFKYFLILSSKDIFWNYLNNEFISNIKQNIILNYCNYNVNKIIPWFKMIFLKTLFAKYIIQKKLKFFCCPHEGLMFDYISCTIIKNFLQKYTITQKHLFNFNACIEEFALQTIVFNNSKNIYYIGNGTQTFNKLQDFSSHKIIYKIIKLS